jgi:hypothetical protein
MIKLKHLLETTLRTNRGSIIRRFKDNVGKKVGTALYVHKLYADEVIPKNILQRAENILARSNPNFAYNSIMFDPQRGIIRFDEAPDFDTASEPTVGNYITVFLNRSNTSPQKGYSDSIWHHKWLWVKDDYTGFDVNKSKEWSRKWLSKLNEPAKGSKLHWQSQLKNVGLSEGLVDLPPVVLGAINPSHDVMSINGVDDYSRHPMNWGAYLKWRYVPELQYLYWWESPSDEENMMVVDYLERKGYTIRKSSVITMRENEDEDDVDDEKKIDVDRLMWNESYLDDVAEQLGYNDDFHNLFWKFPRYLYHCTPEENQESIMKNGINMMDKTRGFASNRHVRAAVFTTSEEEEISSLQNSYGPVVFSINTPQMKRDGYMPKVEQEPDWAKAEKISFVLREIGYPDERSEASLFVDSSEGTTQYTVIVYGEIPPQYLSIYD